MDNQKRDHQFRIRFTEEEFNQIQENMGICREKNMSAYIRDMALHGLILNINTQDIRNLTQEVRRVGNNLNQYAKKANETGSIYEEDIKDLQIGLNKIWEQAKEIETDIARLLNH